MIDLKYHAVFKFLFSQGFVLFIKQQVCQKEEERGHKLLQPLAGMFVANSNEDIRIELSVLEPGWKIKGSKVKVTKQILDMLSSEQTQFRAITW